ncbi:phosphoribosylformylglycinamidine cyclo-ligase [Campylobacter sp. RM9344]|uniref:Phosphoribosylformylglycinamidine cyclo-ligase n=1 Tax=Campylobacter californiensis TaxID=1032243 RepID=A0AAW3ZRI3_9BACT|nr:MULTISPECIES: phosphoribosylformylglycinamidine cyclo-ligase [unclassified Campylobacter]MBE2984608.1 phosphoribosylformylglycinamidine cyclo-ligase [Campylobacter sp. RM6883]MBE2986800.1 phosphoribosylformylglycinamidine cyclo-ligase [Campylobacter sp. RM12919]MBE2988522.1 phosphoribosylformylglycinamidine cyclo-ligase [Campylobacter sp. RM12920]MBE2995104.1 phosphoribosylformylglycinamidine cyclo-ligase [Campylobacter sp. RM6913]MBE3021643.1 phosphoribosylformylglycinamidine cyclo-ligase 
MITYKDAGVDIDAGNEFVNAIKPHVKSTFTPLVLGGIGSFSGAIKLPSGYKNPAILGATDGVGTKLRLAIDANRLDKVGEDLVAMCVNDLICNFATPLFFLDYYATAKLDINSAEVVVKGIAEGCKKASCALIGGETAEMPSMYEKGDFDLAGFAVGMAEIDEIDRAKFVKKGDKLLALSSSGLHSNGYSLARKVVESKGLKFDDKLGDKNLIDLLLEPTRIYVPEFLKLKDKLNALAHITGGGLVENLPRVFPVGLGAKINVDAIKRPEIYSIFDGVVEQAELYRTFNMGVGMVLVVSPENVKFILEDSDAYEIGEVVEGSGVELI